ncbi:hypothetical protein BDR22DRAFT_8055 [Usnea florida]
MYLHLIYHQQFHIEYSLPLAVETQIRNKTSHAAENEGSSRVRQKSKHWTALRSASVLAPIVQIVRLFTIKKCPTFTPLRDSTNSPAADFNSRANQPRRPPVPSLSATPAEIRSFLVDFFTYLDGSLTLPEAEERANKLPLDGKGLYEISPQQWLEVYGLQGQAICQELQESEFGYVRFLLCFGHLLSLE